MQTVKKPKNRPPAEMVNAVKAAHAELAAQRLVQTFGGAHPKALAVWAPRALGRLIAPPVVAAEQVIAEARRTGRKPGVVAATLARRAAKA